MPRRPRGGSGGVLFHVLNRGIRRTALFDGESHFASFERLLIEARERIPVSLLAYCLMPNHFHLVLWPQKDGYLSEFMRWLTVTHTQRRHAEKGTAGTGPVYQGRFKSFPIQADRHFFRVCRYVEGNAVRAQLCDRAEDWRWSSLWHHRMNCDMFPLDPWPIPRSADWIEQVNRRDDRELEVLRLSVRRGRPFGDAAWATRTAATLSLQRTMRSHGRQPRREAGLGSLFSQS